MHTFNYKDCYEFSEWQVENFTIVNLPNLARHLAAACEDVGYARAALRMPFPSEEAYRQFDLAQKESEYILKLIEELVTKETIKSLDEARKNTANMMRAVFAGAATASRAHGDEEQAASMAEMAKFFEKK